MQTKDAGSVHGIDISHYQGNVDFSQLKSAIDFLYVKASEGVTYTDPLFSYYVQSAKANGMLVGAYHFARPDQTSSADEANHFIQLLKTNPTDLYPVLDLESPSKTIMDKAALINWVNDFVQRVHSAIGTPVILYTGKWFADLYNDFDNAFAQYPLWVSSYTNAVADFGGWSEWVIWQYANNGNVPGIQGAVDMNVAVSLEALGYQPPEPIFQLSANDANEIISRWIGHEYDLSSDQDKIERHRLANELRKASGQPIQN